jgi:hypothetical protein
VFLRELTTGLSFGRRLDPSTAHVFVGVGVAKNHLGNRRIFDARRDPRHGRKLHDVRRLSIVVSQ